MNSGRVPLRPPVKKRTAEKKKAPPALVMRPVKSSFIGSIGHDGDVLHVEMLNGDTYEYSGVTAEEHAALLGAQSIGGHFIQHIRSREFRKRPKAA